MTLSADIISLGLALGVGLLVGFERERQPDTVAGVRTFGFAGLIGGLAALLTPTGAMPWPLVLVGCFAGMAGVAGGLARSTRSARGAENAAERTRGANGASDGRESYRDLGLTTAFALVATTLLGGYAVLGDRTIALVAAGVLFLLLYIRDPLHAMIRRLGQEDVRAIATFVLIALVILPVLPDEEIGPFGAVNPRKAWLLVVLVVSMSLAGYIAQKMLGARAGVVATGLLGGLVSSTAATVGAARRARSEGEVHGGAAVALLACSVLPVRLMVLLGVTSASALAVLWPWLAGMAVATVLGGFVALRGHARDGVDAARQARPDKPADDSPRTTAPSTPRNPTELRSALAFAGVFVLIRFLTKAALSYAGAGAFLVVAAISGITDMDAIAMSAANEVAAGDITAVLAGRAILIAIAVNTLFKLGVTRVAGTPQLFRRALPALGAAAVIAAVGVVVL